MVDAGMKDLREHCDIEKQYVTFWDFASPIM